MDVTDSGNIFGFAAVGAGVKVNDDGTFGVYFDNLETVVLTFMLHPRLVDLVMSEVWAAADAKGIELK